MPSQRIVRCEVSRGAAVASTSVRYIPMEIFGLWEYLMVNKHGFNVDGKQASLWIDAEESPDIRSSETRFDDVTEVTLFVYSDTDGMFSRVTRSSRSSTTSTRLVSLVFPWPSVSMSEYLFLCP